MILAADTSIALWAFRDLHGLRAVADGVSVAIYALIPVCIRIITSTNDIFSIV